MQRDWWFIDKWLPPQTDRCVITIYIYSLYSQKPPNNTARKGKQKRSKPGDSSRDLFIPKRWRSLSLSKWSLNHPKKVTKNCQGRLIFLFLHCTTSRQSSNNLPRIRDLLGHPAYTGHVQYIQVRNETLLGCPGRPEDRINGERINGLFHLLNGIYWVKSLTDLITFDPNFLSGTS